MMMMMMEPVPRTKNFYSDCTGAGAGNVGGDRNTGAGGGSAEWMRFLIPIALSETFGAMANSKASSSTKTKKNPKLGKSKNKITRKGRAVNKFVKNS